MIQGVVFDMDGVLADTEHFYQCRREAYLDRMDFPGARGVDFVGSNEKAIWETLVPGDAELREQMLQGYRAYRRFHPEDYRKLADPQVKPLFEELHRRGLRVAIASSSDQKSHPPFYGGGRGHRPLWTMSSAGRSALPISQTLRSICGPWPRWVSPRKPPLRWRILHRHCGRQKCRDDRLCSAPPPRRKDGPEHCPWNPE